MSKALTPDNTRTVVVDGRRVYLVKVARAQRVLIYLVLGVLGCYTAGLFVLAAGATGGMSRSVGFTVFVSASLIALALVLCAIVQTVRLAVASGTHIALAVIGGLFLLFPFSSPFVLLFINISATVVLKRNGVIVGFFGVSAAEMRKLVIGACPTCGYDIRGLPTPQCPECGTQLSSVQTLPLH